MRLELADALNALEQYANGGYDPVTVRRTAEICLAGLIGVAVERSDSSASLAIRAAALFSSANILSQALSTRAAHHIRDAACVAIGSLSPDALFPLWTALGGPDVGARYCLLPVLDYISDPRAAGYLTRILARCVTWPDGELTAWFVVRTLERIGDRSTLSSLRSFASRWEEFGEEPDDRSRRQLALEVARVIAALDKRAARRDNRSLLRPAKEDAGTLLRSPNDLPARDTEDQMELVRVGGNAL